MRVASCCILGKRDKSRSSPSHADSHMKKVIHSAHTIASPRHRKKTNQPTSRTRSSNPKQLTTTPGAEDKGAGDGLQHGTSNHDETYASVLYRICGMERGMRYASTASNGGRFQQRADGQKGSISWAQPDRVQEAHILHAFLQDGKAVIPLPEY